VTVAALVALPLFSAPLPAQVGTGPVPPCTIDPFKSLFIIHPSVVDDPVRTTCWTGPVPIPLGCSIYASEQPRPGVWTFARLMENMAGSTNASTFTENWLNTFLTQQTVNGFTVFHAGKANNIQAFINNWRAASGGGALDLCIAPFRLTAIVFRTDLASINGGGYGGPSVDSAGEGRFVFNILDEFGNETPGNIIFEFNLPARNCEELKAWAQRIAHLSTLPFGPCFNEALQAITDSFSKKNAQPKRPNGSALNQLRTNEITFGNPWEFREWNIILRNPNDNQSGQLRNVTTKQTPDDGHNNMAFLGTYINQDQLAILAGIHVVPEDFMGSDFLGGQAQNFPTVWNAPNIDNSMGQEVELRHLFAIQTCQGCHHRETGTNMSPDNGGPPTPFVHVTGRVPGQPANLSGFLTGISNVPDPVDSGTLRNFNDLERRRVILCRILNLACSNSTSLAAAFSEIEAMQTSSVH
jgi:hypothetical protein